MGAVIGPHHLEPVPAEVAHEVCLEAFEVLGGEVAPPDPALVCHDHESKARLRQFPKRLGDTRQELVVLDAMDVAAVTHERTVAVEEDEGTHGPPSLTEPISHRKRGRSEVTAGRQSGRIPGAIPDTELSMPKKVALITGVTGQDGSYLTELLLDKGYEVHGIARRTSSWNRGRIEPVRESARREGLVFELHYGDLGDSSSLNRIISLVRPDEVYNLAAQSHVGISFQQPEYTSDVDATGTLRLLEAIRSNKLDSRFYQASTSELFGKVAEIPQRETTPFHPRSPYAVAKLYAYWIVRDYREAYDMHASNGILFNHESPRRSENFVTRKVTSGLAQLKLRGAGPVRIGNLEAKRDWGYAPEYVEMMWRMLQQDEPDDYVAATGENHSVRELIEITAGLLDFEVEWEGEGDKEIGRDRKSGTPLVEVDPSFYRPAEVGRLVGDASKAREKLGWAPRVRFLELVRIMVEADLELFASS